MFKNSYYTLFAFGFIYSYGDRFGQIASAQFSNVTMANAQAEITANIMPSGEGVILKLSLPPGTKVNTDAPWKLSLSGNLPYRAGSNPVFDASNYNKKKNLFAIAFKKKVTAKDTPEGTFDLTYFICDKQETWCKQDKVQGEITMRDNVTNEYKSLSRDLSEPRYLQTK